MTMTRPHFEFLAEVCKEAAQDAAIVVGTMTTSDKFIRAVTGK